MNFQKRYLLLCLRVSLCGEKLAGRSVLCSLSDRVPQKWPFLA